MPGRSRLPRRPVRTTRPKTALTFQAGQSSKTIEVAVFDDVHDDGEENDDADAVQPFGGVWRTARRPGRSRTQEPRPPATGADGPVSPGSERCVLFNHVEKGLEAPRKSGVRSRFTGGQDPDRWHPPSSWPTDPPFV